MLGSSCSISRIKNKNYEGEDKQLTDGHWQMVLDEVEEFT